MTVEYYPKEKAQEEFMELTGKQLKIKGLGRAVSKHADALSYAQAVAREISKEYGIISIEDVRNRIEVGQGKKWTLQNAAGAVFAGGDWEWCGFTRATRPEAHARMIRTWKIKT